MLDSSSDYHYDFPLLLSMDAQEEFPGSPNDAMTALNNATPVSSMTVGSLYLNNNLYGLPEYHPEPPQAPPLTHHYSNEFFTNTTTPSQISPSANSSFANPMDHSLFTPVGIHDTTNQYSAQPLQPTSQSLISVNSFDSPDQYYPSLPHSISQPSMSQHIPHIPTFQNHQYLKQESPDLDYKPQMSASGKKRYRVIRGVSAGGCSTRPPKQSSDSDLIFLPVQLDIEGASVEDICYPRWNMGEKKDRRRIIRIERSQYGPKLLVNFSIVGAADENPLTTPAGPDVDVVEVSCLECTVRPNDDYDSQSSDDEKSLAGQTTYVRGEDGEAYLYYITSVEVVEIVELLIGTQLNDPAERRRERGRVRSNLVPFWSKKSISSRMDSSNGGLPNANGPTNQDYRVELAKRIMGYEIRKPRGFDKDVRILRWDKLVPALKRALQSYYTEIPHQDANIDW